MSPHSSVSWRGAPTPGGASSLCTQVVTCLPGFAMCLGAWAVLISVSEPRAQPWACSLPASLCGAESGSVAREGTERRRPTQGERPSGKGPTGERAAAGCNFAQARRLSPRVFCFPGRSGPPTFLEGGEASTLQKAEQGEKGPAAPPSMSLSPPLLQSSPSGVPKCLYTNSHWIM